MYIMPETYQVNGKYHKYKYKLVNGKAQIQNIHNAKIVNW